MNSDGTPTLAPAISDLDIASFAQDLHDRFQAAIDHFDQIGNILVSDWGKLNVAAGNASAGGPWANSLEDGGPIKAGIQLAATRFAYTALFPLAYPTLLRGQRGDSTLDISGDASQYTCWYYPYAGGGDPTHDQTDSVAWQPFQAARSWGGVNPNPVTAAGPQEENWVYAGPINPSDAIGQDNIILYSWAAAVMPPAACCTRCSSITRPRHRSRRCSHSSSCSRSATSSRSSTSRIPAARSILTTESQS